MIQKIVKTGILFILWAIVMPAYAQQKIELDGKWELINCEIRQDSAGIISFIDHQPKDGNIPRWYIFTEITLGKGNYCDLMLNNQVIEGKYTLKEEDILELDFIIMIPTYHFTLKNDTTLVLTQQLYLYGESDPEKGFLDIELSYSKQ